MPVPTRPVASTVVATDWGQDVHDWTFAPVGVGASGAVTNITGTEGRLDLSTVLDDPGGFLDAANDQIEVPADADGLYMMSGRGQIDETSARVRISAYVNGSSVFRVLEDGEASTAVVVPLATQILELAEGDIIHFTSQRTTAGDNPEVRILEVWLVRLGAELGAP